ncbi:UvrD-helicase domain-containing protein [Candidatus Ruminimicrobiellum ovillum]|uniref:UvrD-helicase domain-containing protein n=1 Tax=Candidatus Ruminimicrobiellum ovillum TaxID=1947927 RepID=UPI00355AC037
MDTSKFVVLEASAGSGKTHNLAKRYISLLLNFDSSVTKPPLNNILALTFTNKATIEMKERIIKYLKKISLGQDVKDVLTAVNLPKTKIPSNANIVVNNIINNFDHFNVRTIDSFINLIIKACALKLGVSPNYKILDSYEEYIDYSIDVFLDKSFSDDKVKEVLDTFFEQYTIDNTSSWNIRGNISRTFKKLYKKEITKKIVEIKKKVKYSEELFKLNSAFIEICKKVLEIENIPKFIGGRIKLQKYASDIVSKKKSLFDDNITSFFAKDEVPYVTTLPQEQHSTKLEEVFVKGKTIIQKFMEFKAKHFYDNYIKMFDSILKEFETRAKLDSVMFLQDINKQVSKVFYEQELAPEIYLSLSNNFTDFLIDEFQDTNQIQWQTLKLIVEENLSKGGSFFYVGDKKQAIYGFRGGDYKIFDVPRKEFYNYAPKLTVLDTNYRSCKAIVDFNNKVYSQDNIANLLNYIGRDKNLKDVSKYCEGIVEVFKDSEQKCNTQESGYVEIAYKEYGEDDDFDDLVKQYLYETIDDVLKRFSKKDITIICRKNDEIEKIGRWLLEKGIDIESFQTLNIINSQIIKELFSSLQFFNMPTDNVSFVSFITSDMFLRVTGLSKEEIFKFITDNSLETSNNINLYIKFRKKYPNLWQDYIEDFFNRVGFVAVYEMVVSLISKYKIIENFREHINIIYRFLEIVCDFEKDNQGLQNFIDFFNDFENNEKNEKFFIKVPSSNAIKITTIHKSKGLEYNVVIMPYFYIEQPKEDNIFSIEKEDEISFLSINREMPNYSQELKDIYYEKYFKNISDELNCLYVSTTRAVCEFYALISHKKTKSGNKKSYVEMFIDENNRKFGGKGKIKAKTSDEDEEVIKNIEIIPTKLQDIVDIINDSSIEIYGKKHKDILLNGKIIHYALSQIETFNLQNLQSKIEKAIENTQLVYPDQDFTIFKEKILSLLSNKDIASLFDERNIVFNEKEYVDKFGNTIRTDKIIIKQKEVCIVDFKSSIYDKEYINNQMKNYIDILKDIYADKKVCCCIVDIENEKLCNFYTDTGIE